MGGKQLKIDLSQITDEMNGGPIDTTSVTQKRLYYEDGEVKFDPEVVYPNATGILVDVEETTVVTLQLEKPVSITGEVKCRGCEEMRDASRASSCGRFEAPTRGILQRETVQAASEMGWRDE